MTQTEAPKLATVTVVKDGMNVARYSVATGALLGQMFYSEWDGTYVAYFKGGYVLRTESRGRAMKAMVLGV